MSSEPVSTAPWQQAEKKHFLELNIDAIVCKGTSAEAFVYGDMFSAALADPATPELHRPALEMLRAIMRMHEITVPTCPPFGPESQTADGRRSAIPDDFSGHLIDVMSACLGMSPHPVFQARLAHLIWFLRRKEKETGLKALNAYLDILKMLDAGKLSAHGETTALSVAGHDKLCVAFNLSRGLGYPETENSKLRTITKDLFDCACASEKVWAVLRFGELALCYAQVPPTDIAKSTEKFISDHITNTDDDKIADLWQLAARAYRSAKEQNEFYRCKTEVAECYVRFAEKFAAGDRGASVAAHWMSRGIDAYHGVPNIKERRTALRHRLVDIQSRISDELIPISETTDIRDIIKHSETQFENLCLSTALLRFTLLSRPPDPEVLIHEARVAVAEHPLSAIFGTSHIDAEGKVLATSPGIDLGINGPSGDFEPQISQREGIRRGLAVAGQIEVARNIISLEHRVSKNTLLELLCYSPAIPPRLLQTMVDGFSRYFDGDMVAALYILTPLLEGILRHVLKSAGHDVTTRDDASGTQEDRTITGLYDCMRKELDDIFGRALTEDIRRVFLSKLGPSLRHGVAHALIADGTPYHEDANYACWLIWCLAVYPLIPHWDEIWGNDPSAIH